MKKYLKKGICLILVAMLIGGNLWGFKATGIKGEVGDTAQTNDQKEDNATQKQNDEEAVNALLNQQVKSNGKKEKREHVYVEIKPDGTVKNTTVSDVLKATDQEKIKDVSELNDIENIGGDEKFTRNGNTIIWENKGEDISYQGTTTKKLPIDVKISYYLDDKSIEPDQLVGKSGRVKMVYEYTNNSEEFVPFLILTGMMLDEKFDNITVDAGKVIAYEKSNIVIGYAVPGLKEHLLDSVEGAKDYLKNINLPTSVTVSADVKDFSMGMVLSVATSQLGDLNLENTLDFSDIEEKMDQLKEGSDTLEDGAVALNNGTGKLKKGSKQLYKGADKLKDGTSKVHSGTKKLEGYLAQAYTGMNTLKKKYALFNKALLGATKKLNKGTKKVYKGAKQLQNGTAGAKSGTAKLEEGAKQLDDGVQKLSSGISQVAAGFEDVKDENGNVKSQGLNNGAKILAAGAKKANKGVKEVVGTLQSTPDTIEAQIEQILDKLSKATGGSISTQAALGQTVEKINQAVESGTDLNVVLAASGLDAKTYYSLLQAYYSIQTLQSVQKSFQTQIDKSEDDIKALMSGMESLEDGSANLSDGVSKVYAGMQQLQPGAEKLAKGSGSLKGGLSELSSGTKQLDEGAKKITGAMKKLHNGTNTMNKKMNNNSPKVLKGIGDLMIATGKIDTGAKTLTNATAQLNKGTGKIASGSKELSDGIVTLADGSKKLKNGVIKLNKNGIGKITEIFGEDAKNAIDTIENILNAGRKYQSFSGISDDMSGEVRFIFKVDEISTEK